MNSPNKESLSMDVPFTDNNEVILSRMRILQSVVNCNAKVVETLGSCSPILNVNGDNLTIQGNLTFANNMTAALPGANITTNPKTKKK